MKVEDNVKSLCVRGYAKTLAEELRPFFEDVPISDRMGKDFMGPFLSVESGERKISGSILSN